MRMMLFPDTFSCIKETDIDKTYELPKSAISYCKPRKLSVIRGAEKTS